jgi:hypothetical protein
MVSAHSVAGLMKWLRREEWRDAFEQLLDRHLGRACAKADLVRDKLVAVIGGESFTVLWGCIFEDFLARDLDDGRNIVDDYLKRRGWKEGPLNKAYMVALRSSVMSLYEVSDIVPEQSFLARDLIRGGDPIRVSERSATRSLKPWDRIAARLVQVGAQIVMAGGVLPMDYDMSEVVLQSLRRVQKKARNETTKFVREFGRGASDSMIGEVLSDTEVLRTSAFMFTAIWLDDLLKKTLNPRIPQIYNSDGDELMFTTVHYPLTPAATADAIREALAAIPTLRAENETFWNWIEPQKRASKKRPTDGRTFITRLDDGSLALGTLELKDKTLTLSVNSGPRAQRGRALLDPLLNRLVREPLIEQQTVEQMLASSPKGGKKSSSGLSPDDETAIIDRMLTDHYGRMLDEPIPVLGNATPRKAVKTAKGRQKVISWLKMLENHSAQQPASDPMAKYDFAWLWQELGVTDQRR